MEIKGLALLCLTSFITTLSHHLSNGTTLPLHSDQLKTPHPHIGNTSTIYSQSIKPHVHFVSKRNVLTKNSSHLQLFPGFGKKLVSRRSSGGGWSTWGLNLMNQYFGSNNNNNGWGWGQSHNSNPHHQGNYDWPHKPTHHKASKAAAISKVIFTKAKLLGEMLELKRISTNKFVDAIMFLNKLKTVPKPFFGNLNNPHHYSYNGLPTIAPDKVETTIGHGYGLGGWSGSSGGSQILGNYNSDHRSITGQGWNGWSGDEDSKTTAFKNLGYSIGSSLAGVSKFAKMLGDGYQYGTEGQRWLTHGFGHVNVPDYFPTYKTPDPNKGQFNADQNTGPERLKSYQNSNYNFNSRPSSSSSTSGGGYGYNYGDGNEYSSVKGALWSNSPPSTNFGGGGGTTTTGGSGSGDSFVYEEGGNEITPGLRVPTFKPIET